MTYKTLTSIFMFVQCSWFLVVAIGFPVGAVVNATEGVTTTVNVCPQLMEGTLEREVSVFATTSDISARGEYHNCLRQSMQLIVLYALTFKQQFILLIIFLCACNIIASTDYISIINGEIVFGAGNVMQCIQVAIADDNDVLEEVLETFRVTLTATEPFITIRSQQESVSINIFEDPMDGRFKA